MNSVTYYFGEAWPSGVCEMGEQVATPVGELCAYCDEPIGTDDQGSFIYALEGDPPKPQQRPAHKECSLRAVLGGIGHLRGVCSCRGGHVDTDMGYSYRTSALLVWEWVQAHGIPT